MPTMPPSNPQSLKYIVYALIAQVIAIWGLLLSLVVPIFCRQRMPPRVETKSSRYRLLSTRPNIELVTEPAVTTVSAQRVASLPPVTSTIQIKPSPSEKSWSPFLPLRSRRRAATLSEAPSLSTESRTGTTFKQARAALQRSFSSTDIPTKSRTLSILSTTETNSGPRTPATLLQAACTRTQTALTRTSSRISNPVLISAYLGKPRADSACMASPEEAKTCNPAGPQNVPEQSRGRNYLPTGFPPSIPKRPKLGPRRFSFGSRLQSHACLETCAE
ncbi:hypothetical protein DFH11DRAFT_1256180 [Phellopilus nigrolimitatus]|nr:hypothetical protein DFH11DRAFT_1256180 [Phellopilus nigrolimitatus]